MLAKRLIPCLDVRNGRVVKGKQFQGIEDVDDPATLGKFYSDAGADELVFYDITASSEARGISLDFVADVAKTLQIPFCVGGGVKTLDDFGAILRKGADKISINSAAVQNPNLIKDAANTYGSQCVVLSIDAKQETATSWRVYLNGGRDKTELDVIEWAKKGVMLGAGELVINSMDRDGMKDGYDINLLTQITNAVNVPVIASGGAGNMEHFYDVAYQANVDGILAASVFHFGEIQLEDLKKYMLSKGIQMRTRR